MKEKVKRLSVWNAIGRCVKTSDFDILDALAEEWGRSGKGLNKAISSQSKYHKFLKYENSFISHALAESEDVKVVEWAWKIIDKYKLNVLEAFDNDGTTLLHCLPRFRGSVALAFTKEWMRRGLPLEPNTGKENTPFGVLLEDTEKKFAETKRVLVKEFIDGGCNIVAPHNIGLQLTGVAPEVWTYAFAKFTIKDKENIELILSHKDFPTDIENKSIAYGLGKMKMESWLIERMSTTYKGSKEQEILWAAYDLFGAGAKKTVLNNSSFYLIGKAEVSDAGLVRIAKELEFSDLKDVLVLNLLSYPISNFVLTSIERNVKIYNLALDFLIKMNNNEESSYDSKMWKRFKKATLLYFPESKEGIFKLFKDFNVGSEYTSAMTEGVENGRVFNEINQSALNRSKKFWVKKWKDQLKSDGKSEADVSWLMKVSCWDVLALNPLLEEMYKNGIIDKKYVLEAIISAKMDRASSRDLGLSYDANLCRWERLCLLDSTEDFGKRAKASVL